MRTEFEKNKKLNDIEIETTKEMTFKEKLLVIKKKMLIN